MNVIQAAESHYKSLMDRYALGLNALVGSSDPDALDGFIDAIQKYEHALAQFNVIQNLKAQIVKSETKQESEPVSVSAK